MKDDSSIPTSSLKEEWSLLVHSFLEESPKKKQLEKQLKTDVVNGDGLKSIKRDLSYKKRKLNQEIENIKLRIEQITLVIDNLQLVGSDATGLQTQIDQLNREGEELSAEIIKVDEEIKKIRQIQDTIGL